MSLIKKRGRPKKKKTLFKILIVFGAFLVLLAAGAEFYHETEGWNYINSIYFVVITFTTIGYGDMVPHTQAGKIFTMVFSFLGIATAFYLVSLVGSYIFKKRIKQQTQKLKTKIKKQGAEEKEHKKK